MFDPATNISSPAHADEFLLLITARLVLASHTASPVSFQTDCDKCVDFTHERMSSFGSIQPVIPSVRRQWQFIDTATIKSPLI